MRDEGRHVAFGVNYLEDWIKALPQKEIEDRAEFAYQACVIMRSSKNKEIAQQFLKFIQSAPVKELFQKYGFALPN